MVVIEITNPLEPLQHTRHDGAFTTVEEVLNEVFGTSTPEGKPIIVLVDGEPVLRATWSQSIADSRVVTIIPVVGDFFSIIFVIVGLLISVAIALSIKVPSVRDIADIPEADPVFDIRGQQNTARIGSPIQCPYGRVRLWPSYASRPYHQYVDNDQYIHLLLCLGQGEYSIEATQIEDTATSSFEEVTIAYYGPGVAPTLFPDNVTTSTEVTGQELFGSNEENYPADGWVGPFNVNSSGTDVRKLELDLVMSRGLYYSDDEGGLATRQIDIEGQYREIDDAGSAVGSWIAPAEWTVRFEEATVTPQRRTLEVDVSTARYEVRVRRTNVADESHRVGDTIEWAGMRGFHPFVGDYGDVTLLAIKARATENLSERTQSKFNVVCTRKLRTWNGSAWTARTATRNPVWALLDCFQSQYGGRLLDKYVDLASLLTLANTLDATSPATQFDWVFDQRSTVWEASKAIARSCRSTPVPIGTVIDLIQDLPTTTPVAIYTPRNIVQGSFTWEASLYNLDEDDGVELEYIDETTFKPETMLCLVGEDVGLNPKLVRLPGITNRTRAYREGLFTRAAIKKQRQQVRFSTGLEGHIPIYGDLISVSHDVPRFGEHGTILSISGTTVTLSADVTFVSGSTMVLRVRKKDGGVQDEVVTAGSADNIVELSSPLSPDNITVSDQQEAPMYAFGVQDKLSFLGKVTNLQPDTKDTVQITMVVYDGDIYDGDSATAPVRISGNSPVTPDVPLVVTDLTVTELPNTTRDLRVSWSPSTGSTEYIIQVSYAGTGTYATVGTTPASSFEFTARSGTVYIRVAGVNAGQGPWATVNLVVGSGSVIPGDVANLERVGPNTGRTLTAQWDPVELASNGYITRVRDATTERLLRRIDTNGPLVEYGFTDMVADLSEMQFDGVDDGVLIAGIDDTPYEYSIDFYAHTAINSATTNQVLLSYNTTDSGNHSLVLGSNTSFVTNEVITWGAKTTGPTVYYRTAVTSITIGIGWHNITILWDVADGEYHIYLDGVKQTTTSGTKTHVPLQTMNDFMLGKDHDDNFPLADARVWHLLVYDEDNKNIGEWFNKGNTWTDESGGGNNGAVEGSPTIVTLPRARNIDFEVVAENVIGESDTATVLNIANPLPAAPTGQASRAISDNGSTSWNYLLSWTFAPEFDFRSYSIYGSSTSSFTAGPSNLLGEGMGGSNIIEVTGSGGNHTAFYWRVASIDVWGDELTQITAEQTIAAV